MGPADTDVDREVKLVEQITHKFTHSFPPGNYDVICGLNIGRYKCFEQGKLFSNIVRISICICL